MDIEVELEHILRRVPVSNMATLEALNSDEIQEGYRDGFDGEPCGDNRSRSYWHGWRNGMIDKGRLRPDWASMSLAHEYVESTKRPMWGVRSSGRERAGT
jgi:ribosome modulation factor